MSEFTEYYTSELDNGIIEAFLLDDTDDTFLLDDEIIEIEKMQIQENAIEVIKDNFNFENDGKGSSESYLDAIIDIPQEFEDQDLHIKKRKIVNTEKHTPTIQINKKASISKTSSNSGSLNMDDLEWINDALMDDKQIRMYKSQYIESLN